jgi:DNA processing protein
MHRNQLIAYAYRYLGSNTLIKKALLVNEPYHQVSEPFNCITILDLNYPNELRRLSDPPYVLFLKGQQEILHKKKIAIIGSRKMCSYAKIMTDRLIASVSSNYVVVSGLAHGVDGCAHQCALQYKIGTIAVLAFGFDTMYPKAHLSLAQDIECNGLLISQYPPHTPIEKYRFVERNRIIAALSDVVCVMQAGIKSGTMSTVNAALDCGIDVFCLPYHVDEPYGEGNNLLIQQGANILTNFNDMIKL